MNLQAYCPYCEKAVAVLTILGGNELKHALNSGAAIEVMHLSDGPDHRWNLLKQEKENLRTILG